jgi:hypothetical protein
LAADERGSDVSHTHTKVGRLKEVEGVISQGKTLANIRDAYQLVTEDMRELGPIEVETKEITVV